MEQTGKSAARVDNPQINSPIGFRRPFLRSNDDHCAIVDRLADKTMAVSRDTFDGNEN
jgi:hypothetical protein